MAAEQSELGVVLDACRRHAALLLAAALSGIAAAALVTTMIQPRYEASATLFVGDAVDRNEPMLGLQQTTLAQSLVRSYAQLAETRSVATAAARSAGVPPDAVLGRVRAESEPGVHVLRLHASAGSGALAARIANAAARALDERIETLGPARGPVSIQVIDAAVAPSQPTSPRMRFSLLLGALAGLLTGAGLALARDNARLEPLGAAVASAQRQVERARTLLVAPPPRPSRNGRHERAKLERAVVEAAERER